jgi:DNA repair exonuclease SbcCD ATPase subunit
MHCTALLCFAGPLPALQLMRPRTCHAMRAAEIAVTQLLPRLHAQLEQAAHLRRQLPAADERIRELERQLAAVRQQRGEAEAALQRERSQGGGQQTAAELQTMISALQARRTPRTSASQALLHSLPAGGRLMLAVDSAIASLHANALAAERADHAEGCSWEAQAAACRPGGRQAAAPHCLSALLQAQTTQRVRLPTSLFC